MPRVGVGFLPFFLRTFVVYSTIRCHLLARLSVNRLLRFVNPRAHPQPLFPSSHPTQYIVQVLALQRDRMHERSDRVDVHAAVQYVFRHIDSDVQPHQVGVPGLHGEASHVHEHRQEDRLRSQSLSKGFAPSK